MRKLIVSLLLGAAVFTASYFCAYADNADSPDDPSSIAGWSYETDSNVFIGESDLGLSGVSLDMTYGYRDIAKSGHKLPVRIKLTNYDAEDFSGKLVIETEGSVETGLDVFDACSNRYIFEVSVPAGSSEIVESIISVSEDNGNVKLKLNDSNGELIREKNQVIRIASDSAEMLIGILSDAPEKLQYFNGLNIANSSLRTHVAELYPEMIPDSALELDQLDMIVISGLDMRTLPEKKIQTIQEWTENGGVLLIGSGRDSAAAEIFAKTIPEFQIGPVRSEEVDMGMKYSKTGPDGAVLSLDVREIVVPEGMQVLQSSDVAILTTVAGVNGMIGFTAYDLCDISEFCQKEMGYTDELIQSLLGSARIARLINSSGSSREVYEKTKEFMGIAAPGSTSGIMLYVVFAFFYLMIICWILYLGLRNRGLEIYYHSFVMITAVAGAFVLWIAGYGLRHNGVSMDCNAVREIHGSTVNQAGFIRLFSASSDDYTVTFPNGYDIYPIVHEITRETGDDVKTSGTDYGRQIDFHYSEETEGLTASGLGPFAGSMLEFSAKTIEETENTISAKLRFFKENISGQISNHSDHTLTDAAILMYGRVIRIGTLPAHGDIDLAEANVLTAPTSETDLIAAYITGLHEKNRDSSEYITALRKSRFLSYYMQEALAASYSGARIVAFREDGTVFSKEDIGHNVNVDGQMLEVCFAETDFSNGNRIWRNGLTAEPIVISGDYNSASNTSHGSAVVEYNLGTDVVVNKLYFTELDELFSGEAVQSFNGQISLYNYQSGNYEYIGNKRDFTGSEIAPYLSPANTLMARFLPDSGSIGQVQMFLPIPNILGTER